MHVVIVRLSFRAARSVDAVSEGEGSFEPHVVSYVKGRRNTDKIPTANMDIASAFCQMFIFNFHISAAGSMIIHMSSAMLTPEWAKAKALTLKHFPSCSRSPGFN